MVPIWFEEITFSKDLSLFASGLLNHITVSSAFIIHSHRLFHYNANDHSVLFRIPPVWVCVPVGGCWEDPQDDIPALHAYDGAGGLQQVEVEVRVSRDRAVQTRFQKRRPLALQHTLRAAQITFTHTCHTGHHHLMHTHTHIQKENSSVFIPHSIYSVLQSKWLFTRELLFNLTHHSREFSHLIIA